MICPFCKKDYKDPPQNRPNGGYFRQDEHFYHEVRRFGMLCQSCGEVAEVLTVATGKRYLRNQQSDKDREETEAVIAIITKGK